MDNLLGKRVMNLRTHKIGRIVGIKNNILTVSFHGDEAKYSYPDAFSSILELEDERLQEEISEKAAVSAFDRFQRSYGNAINSEISFLKKTGGRKYRAVDGERIPTKNDEYLYTFDTDSEYHFPDGTPLSIWLTDRKVNAYVVSCEDFTLMIRSTEYIGDIIPVIEFTAEQWKLLDSLMERIQELRPEDSSIAYELAAARRQILPCERMLLGQAAAFGKATSEPITFIWGPPGTGKTEILAKIALDYIEHGKRVLMLSYSNVSVDGALLRVADKADFDTGVIVRYGYPRVEKLVNSKTLTSFQIVLNEDPALAEKYQELLDEQKRLKRNDSRRKEIKDELKKIREDLNEKEKELIRKAAFVATTISKTVIDKALYTQNFDVVIFDEASMAYVPQIVFAASLAREAFVCLGDFRQLPAIVQNKSDQLLKRDIFDYTGITEAVENGMGHKWLVMLNKQYRMHQDIADFASRFMYSGQLKTAEKIRDERQLIADCEPLASEAMCMVDLSNTYSVCIKTMDGSRINLLSALISVSIAKSLADRYEVGIITPYSAQSRLIIAMLRDLQEKDKNIIPITCATVHQFQGSEKPIIIYDAVDCFRMQYPGMLLTEVENDNANRLFNVALTRAQGKFILVANRDFMFRKKLSKTLMFTKELNTLMENESFLDGEDYIDLYATDGEASNILYVNDKEGSWKFFLADINNAKKKIQIDIPGLLDEDLDCIRSLQETLNEAANRNVSVQIRTEENIMLPTGLKQYVKIHGYVTTPVTVIDNKIIWFGHPVSAADFISEGEPIRTEFFPCIRFVGTYTARILSAFYGN